MLPVRSIRRIAASWVAAMFALHAVPVVAACTADSGPDRATLVELYTSEGCSSCPLADRRLGELIRTGQTRQKNVAGSKLVPLALHVDYWDSIGWTDPFAQASFTRRQDWEVRANAHRTSYTPHFFVNGKEVLDWRSDLDDNLRRAAVPGAARGAASGAAPDAMSNIRIRIDAQPLDASSLRLKVDETGAATTRTTGALQLFVAVTESGLTSQVSAGENRGARLEHDAVVRHWIGPIAVLDGSAHLDRVVGVPQLSGGQVSIVAFVQDATTAEVLQAVGTERCERT